MRWLIYLSLGLFWFAGPGYGGLISPQTPLDLEQKADLIVVGSAGSDIEVGSKVANFDLRVNRVVAGDPEVAGNVIPVTWTMPGGFLRGISAPVGQHIVEKGTGLWFLERSPTGWALLPAITGNSVSLKDAFFPT